MRLSTPRFWYRRGRAGRALWALLAPVSLAYAAIARRRRLATSPLDPGVPVICVGNLTLGGSGKTPAAREILRRLRHLGLEAHGLSRGYGGQAEGPLRVDLARHDARWVGDEALMLAGDGPMWVARRRAEGALAAAAAGAEVVVLDDGHQNGALVKRLSLVVVDGETRNQEWPFGSEDLFPLGPLREPLAEGLARADAVIVMTPLDVPAPDPELLAVFKGQAVLIARTLPSAPPPPGPVLAFAGVAKPWRVERALRLAGCEIADFAPFPDHHRYSAADLRFLDDRARALAAGLLTTEKDHVRLPSPFRERVGVFKVTTRFDDPDALDALLRGAVGRPPRD